MKTHKLADEIERRRVDQQTGLSKLKTRAVSAVFGENRGWEGSVAEMQAAKEKTLFGSNKSVRNFIAERKSGLDNYAKSEYATYKAEEAGRELKERNARAAEADAAQEAAEREMLAQVRAAH